MFNGLIYPYPLLSLSISLLSLNVMQKFLLSTFIVKELPLPRLSPLHFLNVTIYKGSYLVHSLLPLSPSLRWHGIAFKLPKPTISSFINLHGYLVAMMLVKSGLVGPWCHVSWKQDDFALRDQKPVWHCAFEKVRVNLLLEIAWYWFCVSIIIYVNDCYA